MNSYIIHNSEYNVLICKKHEYAVSEEFLTRHFRTEHDLSLELRQEILAYASQFTPIKPADLSYTSGKIVPIPYLRIIDGFQCTFNECDTILGTVTSMTKHCREKHNWKSKDGERWSNVRAQTFYQGPLRRYYMFYITLIEDTLRCMSRMCCRSQILRNNC